MNNFESSSLPVAPEKLSDEEVEGILVEINDERLRANEDGEHFTFHHDNKIIFIPKRKSMNIQDEEGNTFNVGIEEYIKNVIGEYETN